MAPLPRAAGRRAVVIGTTSAHHPHEAFRGPRGTEGVTVARLRLPVEFRVMNILAPLPDVPMHVVQAKTVRLVGVNRNRPPRQFKVCLLPGQLVSERKSCACSGPTCILPLGLRGQSEAGQPAELLAVFPRDVIHRESVAFELGPIVPHNLLPLRLAHFVFGDEEATERDLMVRLFSGYPLREQSLVGSTYRAFLDYFLPLLLRSPHPERPTRQLDEDDFRLPVPVLRISLFIRPDVLERPNEPDPGDNLLPIHAEQQGERQNPRPSYNRNSPSFASFHAGHRSDSLPWTPERGSSWSDKRSHDRILA